MKRVAYLMASFPVLSETFVSTELRALRKQGHEVLPFAFNRHNGPYQQSDEDLKQQTRYLEDLGKLEAVPGLFKIHKGLGQALSFALSQQGLPKRSLMLSALKLARLMKQANCNHIHAHFAQATAATAITAARLCGITVSFVGHGYDIYATPSDLPLKLSAADFSVAVCKDMQQYFEQLCPVVNAPLIYCGVDWQRFNPPARTSYTSKHLLFIGRLCHTKGLFTLLDALEHLPCRHRPMVDIVGDGELKEQLQQRIDERALDDKVTLLGAKQSGWLIKNVHRYGALIAPFEMAPNGDRDTGPVVVKEAMALRLPVITTEFMGCKEMVTDECGLKTPPGDAFALAGMIRYFFTFTEEQISKMVEAAYLRVKTCYSAEHCATLLSNCIERARTKSLS